MDTAPSATALFVYVGVCVLLVFVWLAEQGFFLYRYTQATKGGEKAPGSVLVLWGASAAFVFTGPCVVVLCFGSLVGGLVHLKKRGPDNEATRLAALATVVTSATVLVFAVVGIVVLGLGGYLG